MAEFRENTDISGSSVQSVQRALHLLSLVARTGPPGARLQDLTQESGLSKPTTHRLLQQLIESGLVMQGGQRLYQLGAGAFELGISASRSFPLRDIASPVLDEIARITGDTVFLVVRSGIDALCIDRKMGSYPIKVETVEPGHRQSLGMGASGLAVLSFLPQDEQESCLLEMERSLKLKPQGDLTMEVIRRHIAESKPRRWALMTQLALLPGVTGVGVPVFDAQKRPFASLTVGAISLRMTEQRIRESAALLLEKARVLEKLWANNSK